MIVQLQFDNKTAAKPDQQTKILCDVDSVPKIVQWYGGFYFGDDYEASVDDIHLALDRNGEMMEDISDIKAKLEV